MASQQQRNNYELDIRRSSILLENTRCGIEMSPDGTMFVFEIDRNTIAIRNRNGGEFARFEVRASSTRSTSPAANIKGFVWSPDSEYLIVVKKIRTVDLFRIIKIRDEIRGTFTVTVSLVAEEIPAVDGFNINEIWDPGSSKFVLQKINVSYNIYDTTGTLRRTIKVEKKVDAKGRAVIFEWSPNGKFLLFLFSNLLEINDGEHDWLNIYDYDNDRVTWMRKTFEQEHIYISGAHWAPNSIHVAVLTGFHDRFNVLLWDTVHNITHTIVDREQTVDAEFAGKSLQWSPDGKSLAVILLSHIIIYDIKSGGAKVTITGAGSHLVRWSFNSEKLIVVSNANRRSRMDHTSVCTFDTRGNVLKRFILQDMPVISSLSSNWRYLHGGSERSSRVAYLGEWTPIMHRLFGSDFKRTILVLMLIRQKLARMPAGHLSTRPPNLPLEVWLLIFGWYQAATS